MFIILFVIVRLWKYHKEHKGLTKSHLIDIAKRLERFPKDVSNKFSGKFINVYRILCIHTCI